MICPLISMLKRGNPNRKNTKQNSFSKNSMFHKFDAQLCGSLNKWFIICFQKIIIHNNQFKSMHFKCSFYAYPSPTEHCSVRWSRQQIADIITVSGHPQSLQYTIHKQFIPKIEAIFNNRMKSIMFFQSPNIEPPLKYSLNEND